MLLNFNERYSNEMATKDFAHCTQLLKAVAAVTLFNSTRWQAAGLVNCPFSYRVLCVRDFCITRIVRYKEPTLLRRYCNHIIRSFILTVGKYS